VWVAGLASLAAAVAVVVLVTHDGDSDRRAVPSPQRADELARQACTLTRTLLAEVEANGSSATVVDLADRASTAADSAAYGSAEWVSLNGAVQALTRALHVNDGRLAAIGMQQIDEACAATGVTVR
jgi:hypothetical protein